MSERVSKMYKTERLAYSWLLRQGYEEKDIVYQPRRTPDFLTSDGKRFEVKKRYNDVIWFTGNQFNALKTSENTVILVFDLDKLDPVVVIPSPMLEQDTVIDGIKITVAAPLEEGGPRIRVSEQVKQMLDTIKEQNGHTSHDSVMRSLLSSPCKGTQCSWYWNCVKYGCAKFLKTGVTP